MSEPKKEVVKKPKNKLLRVLLIILGIVFWPFSLGYLLCKYIYNKVNNQPLKWALIVPIAFISLLFGTSWAAAIGGYKPSEQSSNPQPQQQQDKIETKTVTETQPIAFETQTADDNSINKGETRVVQEGQNGIKTITYEVTYKNGQQVDKRQTKDEVTAQPVTKVVHNGTYVAPPPPQPKCDPNYSGACVPIASDVDCAGGSGNGPAYVQGPVKVIGRDIYDLDRDGDGVGCDK